MHSLLGPLDTTKLKFLASCSRQSASPVNSPTSWRTSGIVSMFLHQSSPTSGKKLRPQWLPPRRLLSISKPNFRKGCRGWKSSKQTGPYGFSHETARTQPSENHGHSHRGSHHRSQSSKLFHTELIGIVKMFTSQMGQEESVGKRRIQPPESGHEMSWKIRHWWTAGKNITLARGFL